MYEMLLAMKTAFRNFPMVHGNRLTHAAAVNQAIAFVEQDISIPTYLSRQVHDAVEYLLTHVVVWDTRDRTA